MPEEIRISDKGDYLLVTFIGEFSVEAGKRCVDRMTDASKEHNCTKILLDCRKMTGGMPIFNRFEVTVYGVTEMDAVSKFALVVLPEVALPDHFVENVAFNRGMNLKVFTEIEQAQHWLSESSKNKGKQPTL